MHKKETMKPRSELTKEHVKPRIDRTSVDKGNLTDKRTRLESHKRKPLIGLQIIIRNNTEVETDYSLRFRNTGISSSFKPCQSNQSFLHSKEVMSTRGVGFMKSSTHPSTDMFSQKAYLTQKISRPILWKQ